MKKILSFCLASLLLLSGCSTKTSEIDLLFQEEKNKIFMSINHTSPKLLDPTLAMDQILRIRTLEISDSLQTGTLVWFGYMDGDDYKTTQNLVDQSAQSDAKKTSDLFSVIEGTEYFYRKTDPKTWTADNFTVLTFEKNDKGQSVMSEYFLKALYNDLSDNDVSSPKSINNIAEKMKAKDETVVAYSIFTEVMKHDEQKALHTMLLGENAITEYPMGINKPFRINGMEYTLSNDAIQWQILKNQFSVLNGREVFLVPFKMHNIDAESSYIPVGVEHAHGPNGEVVESSGSFMSDDFRYAGYVKQGETIDTYYSILYEGDGMYQIHFGDHISIQFEIKK